MEITVDSAARSSGKTHRLVVRASENELCIVCSTRSEADRVAKYAVELGLVMQKPITAEDFQYRRYNRVLIKGFLIDEATAVLQRMSYVPIHGITVTSSSRNPFIKFFETLLLGDIKVSWFKPIMSLRFNYFRHYASCKTLIRIECVCVMLTISHVDKELTALYKGI